MHTICSSLKIILPAQTLNMSWISANKIAIGCTSKDIQLIHLNQSIASDPLSWN